nr:hypothetical protein [Bacteroidota bacterium]
MSISGKNQILLLVAVLVVLVAVLAYFFVLRPNNAYKSAISKADENYVSQNYPEAKKLYNQASEMKPDEGYPLSRIHSIDSIFDARNKVKNYNQKIAEGDNLFNLKEYENARGAYFEAVNIDPDKSYPVDQIRKIDELLANREPIKPKPSGDLNYHIIVGSFEFQSNAEILYNNMLEQGFRSLLIPRDELGMIAVTAGSYPDIHQAWNNLPQAQEGLDEEAWVLYHEFR